MYKLNPLVQKLTDFVHTDSMYKLGNRFLPHSNDSNISDNISCGNTTSERDQTILNELHQLDNSITFLLNTFQSYKPKKPKKKKKKRKNRNQTTTASTKNTATTTATTTATSTIRTTKTTTLQKSFVNELHELSSHVNNLLNYPKADPTTTTKAQSVQTLLSRLDGELNSLIDIFTSYPSQLVNTTTPSTSVPMMNCLLTKIPKEPVTFIIQCNPYDPPCSLLLFLHLLVTNNFKVTIKSFNHSELPKSLQSLFHLFIVSSRMNVTDTNLHLHFIWNPLCTECKVSRVGVFFIPGAYGETILVQQIYNLFESAAHNDNNNYMPGVILMIYSSFVSLRKSFPSSSKLVRLDRESTINFLDKYPYFVKITRVFPSIVDCLLYDCINRLNLFNELPGNLKLWVKFCRKWDTFR
ncbi:unnamed protein product [Trichobilharzia regenti]|nr:unnamed protein product [Trichobilharzia regenti]